VASKSLVKWLKMLWENWKSSVWCVVCCFLSLSLVPCGGGVRFPFIGQGESELHASALSSYMGKYGAPRRRVGGRLNGPCRDLAIMAYLVPEQWWL
jgi:hypothetical protein